jgi:hypothetical protein
VPIRLNRAGPLLGMSWAGLSSEKSIVRDLDAVGLSGCSTLGFGRNAKSAAYGKYRSV